jgi:hypothetical protein
MIRDLMWVDPLNPVLYIDDDLYEYLLEHSFETEGFVINEARFVELWELVVEWQKEVQK